MTIEHLMLANRKYRDIRDFDELMQKVENANTISHIEGLLFGHDLTVPISLEEYKKQVITELTDRRIQLLSELKEMGIELENGELPPIQDPSVRW